MQNFFPDLMYPNQNVRNFPDAIALQYLMPDEVHFGTCNRHTVGYSKTRVFTPIFLKLAPHIFCKALRFLSYNLIC